MFSVVPVMHTHQKEARHMCCIGDVHGATGDCTELNSIGMPARLSTVRDHTVPLPLGRIQPSTLFCKFITFYILLEGIDQLLVNLASREKLVLRIDLSILLQRPIRSNDS
jgi:hypothetical protein